MARREFFVGDPTPWFVSPSSNNPRFHFETCAGRYIILSFLDQAGAPESMALMAAITGEFRERLDDENFLFFGVTTNPDDAHSGKLSNMVPGIRHFWDFDRSVSTLYGAYHDGEYHPFTLVLDPFMRVLANIRHTPDNAHIDKLRRMFAQLPVVDMYAGVPIHAPILVLPRVFEPSFCRDLIKLYDAQGGSESGFMREKDGKTVAMLDSGFKRRKDFMFDHTPEQADLRGQIRARLNRRLIPAIQKAFQFEVTRIERYIVACYEGETKGFFKAHRDNTTRGTAHRRFACTLNLNAEEYDGGDLRFPEFGTCSYRAPTGGAVVFSCSLLHEATPVTRGKRYAFLPFLYDEAAEKIRNENAEFLSEDVIDLNAAG